MAKKNVKVSKDTKIVGKVDAVKYVTEIGFPEVGQFSEQKDLQKFYKQLDIEVIEEWIGIEGIEFKGCDSEQIHRMRACMAILYKHFPKEPSAKAKSKSKYADYTLEQLVSMAVDNDVAVEPTDDERILRMRVIMSLRASKIID